MTPIEQKALDDALNAIDAQQNGQTVNDNGYLEPEHAWPMADGKGEAVSDGVRQ